MIKKLIHCCRVFFENRKKIVFKNAGFCAFLKTIFFFSKKARQQWIHLICSFFIAVSATANATPQKLPNQIKLNISFDWQEPNQPFNNAKIHVKKTIVVHPEQTNYVVVTSETKADDKLPTTWALLVKPMDVSHKQMTLQFMLVQYGLNHNGEIIAEPNMIFNNGQSAKILTAADDKAIKLKVSGRW